MVQLAHLSDLHATPVRVDRLASFVGKRFLGWLSWRMRRGRTHRPEVLEALLADLPGVAADHVVVTGDLTNVACEREFQEALAWLQRLGSPERVSAVPGNHDAYVPVPRERSWDLWSEYLRSDEGGGPARFPTLRRRGPLAIVGVSSAVPTAPFLASGRVGPEQLARLEKLLGGLADSPLCRVVLIHHPPREGSVSARRALSDAAAFRAVLARHGADLVLHGHGHRTLFGTVPGPRGPIPVVGARSASDVGSKPGKRAQYHVYEIEGPGSGEPRFRIIARIRGYDPAAGGFVAEGERSL